MRKAGLLMMVVAGTLVTGAGYAYGGVIDHETFKGTFAFANFSIDMPETCADGTAGTVNTFVNVSGSQSRTSSRLFPSESLNSVSVSVTTSDGCTGLSTLTFGQVSGGFAPSTTRTATLNATVPLVDDLGNSAGTATVALTLNAVQFIGGFTSAGIVQDSSGSVDIKKN
jgi:hypothetical protein